MSLEATIICLDNSEWSRNGDYSPNRWESQQEAAIMVAGAKSQANQQNSIGIIASAGPRVQVLVSPTSDIAMILNAVHSGSIKGKSDLYTALKIAQLALKNRPNKDQKQRIVAFVCSPVSASTQKLTELGRNLKRNNVAIDIVCFGYTEDTEKLQQLQKAANNSDNSHFITIPQGLGLLCEALRNTPILYGGGAEMPQFEQFGGVDPNIDPELASVLRMTLEQSKRQHQEQPSEPMTEIPEQPQEYDNQQARQLEEAIKMSLIEDNPEEPQSVEPGFINQEFVSSVLQDLPGIDLNDPAIKAALEDINKGEEEKQEEKKEEEQQS